MVSDIVATGGGVCWACTSSSMTSKASGSTQRYPVYGNSAAPPPNVTAYLLDSTGTLKLYRRPRRPSTTHSPPPARLGAEGPKRPRVQQAKPHARLEPLSCNCYIR